MRECTIYVHRTLNVTIYVLFTDHKSRARAHTHTQSRASATIGTITIEHSHEHSNNILIIHALDINHFKLNGGYFKKSLENELPTSMCYKLDIVTHSKWVFDRDGDEERKKSEIRFLGAAAERRSKQATADE